MPESGAQSGQTSPPAGTGNVPGLGESFSINLNTGQGIYSYKLPLPDGVANHTPKLSLEYSHGGGHGLLGLGWRLAMRSISRRLDFGVPEQGAVERFMDSGAEIVPVADGTFRVLAESAFNRYSRSGDGWKIEERNGIVHEMGLSAGARVSDPGRPDRVHEWLLERSLDTSGNAISYAYLILEGIPYLSEIRYAAYAVRFVYEDRPDARLDGRMGFLRRRTRRCQKTQLVLDPGAGERLIRSWTFSYTLEPSSGLSLLSSIQMTSHGRAADGSQDVRRAPVTFQYSDFTPRDYSIQWMEDEGSAPPPLSDTDVALVTLDNAPLPGVLKNVGGRQYYWRNRGDDSWGFPLTIARTPNISSFGQAGLAFIDMDASGTADLMVTANNSLNGYYENGGRNGWSRFVIFPRNQRTTPDWFSGRLRLTDSDGDGRIDALMSGSRAFAVWLNRSEQGWAEPLLAPKGTGEERPDVDFSDPLVQMADMTGDGLQDIVQVRSGRIEYWPSLGRGRFGARVVMRGSPRLRDLQRSPQNLFMMDVDGDGCADLVYVSAAGVEIFINKNGASFADPVVIDTIPTPLPGTVRAVNMRGRNGSGLLWNSYRGREIGYVYLELGAGQPPYLLTKVNNGSGLISEIQYRAAIEDYLRDFQSGERWETNFPFPLLVVAGTKEVDQVSGLTVEASFLYHQGHFEPRLRQFQGFQRTERIEKGDESRADTRTVFNYLMGQERLQGNGPEHASLNGMLRRTEIYSLDGSPDEAKPFRVEEADYNLRVLDVMGDGRKRVFIFVNAHRTEDRERTADVRVEEKLYTYDEFGNVVRERLRGHGTRGGVAQPERIVLTDITYAKSATRWLTDKPARVVIRDDSGAIISEKRRYYDGADFVGLPSGQAERGLLAREEQLVLSRADFDAHYAGMDAAALGYSFAPDADNTPAVFVNSERHAYNAAGVKRADRDALGRDTTFEFDATNLLRTRLTDSLGVTRFTYDRAVAQPTLITYADGSQTRFTYDAQGRVLATAMPGEAINNPPRSFSYDDTSIPNARTARFRFSPAPGDRAVALTYFDGRGKEFQQRLQTDVNRFVVSGLNLKNPWGDLKREFEPTFANTPAFGVPATAGRPHRDIFYDARGRVVKIVNYSGGTSTATYTPFAIITRDANDNDNSPDNVARGQFDTPRREEVDVLRHRTKVIETLAGGATMTTTYRTSVAGDVLEVRDPNGVMCGYRYDRLGNRLVINQRDVGQRQLWYNACKKVVRTRDAEGNDVQADIDARDRITRLKAGAVVLEEYVYDDPARNALGRLARVTYRGGQQLFNYDTAGRLLRHEYLFDGLAAPQTLTYEYDLLGRETAVTHTDGTRVAKTLTPNGWVRAIPGFLNQVDYDPRGLPSRLVYANNVTTELSYTPGPGRVMRQKTLGPAAQVMEDVNYQYDKLELLLSSNDTAPGGAGLRAYGYDPLYQITSFTSNEAAGPVTRRYEYTNHFNLTRFDETNSQLHYDDALHPDRVAGLTPQGGARANFNYDNNGNLLNMPGKTFRYNEKSELARFATGAGLVAEYRYDHQGIRVSKSVKDGPGPALNTYFVGDAVEIRNGQPAIFVHLGRLRVAIKHAGTLRFVHGDYLGGTSFFTDAAGTKIAAISYRPYGNLASSSGTVDFRTYSIHPFDAESGLYYMKRRYYSPELGRFLTPDPIAVYQPSKYLHNPKALHPYIYVGNDPLNKEDIDGLSFWSVVGAIVGVIAAIAVAALFIVCPILGVIALIGIVAVSYIVADATAGTGFGEFMRGFMIGLNAGLNAIIATALFGPVVGIALGVINFLAAFDTIAASPVYQGILGWSSWLMPMSWLATGVGLLFFVINLVVAGVTLNQVSAVSISSISIDWGTGTIMTSGGLIRPAGGSTGFNLGNFVFLSPGSTAGQHETGHTLNVAAYGAIFHYIGAIDENVVPGRGAGAYAERFADSHDPTTAGTLPTWADMWR